MADPQVREANSEDEEGIYSLARELAAAVGDSPPTRKSVRTRFEELREEPRAFTLVAEGEGGISGVVSFWIKPDLAHGDVVVEVPMLVVAEEHRRAGVGKLLVEEVRRQASGHEATVIELIATGDNTTAREFYRSLGFVETDHVALEFMGDLHDPPESEEK
ncbi:MAG: GNAT family N-acetyltransferase [Rubrobacteraceae bacterium]